MRNPGDDLSGQRVAGGGEIPGGGWSEELDDAVRGLASGFLIGVPVVFTVDVWWLGDQTGPFDSLFLLVFAYLLSLAAVYWIGFRRGLRRGWQYLGDAAEAVALAALALVVIYWALGQVGDGQPAAIALGRIAVALAPVCLGVAIANHLLRRDGSPYAPDTGDATALRDARWHGKRHQRLLELGAALAGAMFVSIAIVPTNDFNAMTTEVPVRNLPFVILLSLLVTYTVVFAAGFSGERRRHHAARPPRHPVSDTITDYLLAFAVALFVLWVFGRIDETTAPFVIYAKTVLLAFPASMGAAGGRLAV
jgi:putative integral membrane protein (TIGR02587 family)